MELDDYFVVGVNSHVIILFLQACDILRFALVSYSFILDQLSNHTTYQCSIPLSADTVTASVGCPKWQSQSQVM